MVIDFDGVKVQLPSVETNNSYIFIEFKNGKYAVASEKEYKKDINKKQNDTKEFKQEEK